MDEFLKATPPDLPLATLTARFVAAILDGVLMAFLLVILLYATGMADSLVEFAELSPSARENHEVATLGFAFKLIFLQIVTFLMLNLVTLHRYGQTLGKRALKIAIVNSSGQVPPLSVLLINRYLSQVLMGLVPVIGGMLRFGDVLLIFRADRRCFHDTLAKTYVIDVSKPISTSTNNNHLIV